MRDVSPPGSEGERQRAQDEPAAAHPPPAAAPAGTAARSARVRAHRGEAREAGRIIDKLEDDYGIEALERELGGSGERLRSRFGKDAALYVDARRGVAYAEENGALVALEVFPPTTLDRYRDEIWWEPPGFIR